MSQQWWEDAAGSCSLTAKHCYVTGRCGLIPAAYSGGKVNEHSSRQEELQIWKNKEVHHGNTCGGIKLLLKHSVALFLLTKKGCALSNRGSKCLSRSLFLLELENDSCYSKARFVMSIINNIGHFLQCCSIFQKLSTSLYIFIVAYSGALFTTHINILHTFFLQSFCHFTWQPNGKS